MRLFSLDDYAATSSEGFTKRVFLQSAGGLVFRLNFAPGQSLPPHKHDQSEIAVQVLEGEAEVRADDQVENVRAGQLAHCGGSETFSVRNTGPARLSLLVFLYPGNSRFAADVR